MAKRKKENTLGGLLKTTTKLIKDGNSNLEDDAPYIPSITEFCESTHYLGLPHLDSPIILFPIQKLALRAFYRGSPGNTSPECMTMTDEEIELCHQHGLDSEKNGNILGKWGKEDLFKELVLVWGRRCLSGDTRYIDPKTGKIWTLGEMWKCGITDNLQSWTYDKNAEQMRLMTDCNLIYQGKRIVHRLLTRSGHEIEATDNHPFLTPSGWMELKNLRIGDKVALASAQPFFGNSSEISEGEAGILGYVTGDGCCSQSSVFFTCSDEEILRDFTEKLEKACPDVEIFKDPWTGAKSAQYQYKIRYKDKENVKYEKYFNNKQQRIYSKRTSHSLKKLLIKHDLMGKTCHYKEVPKALYECPKNVIASYLRALYSCDGNISVNTKNGRNTAVIEFYTVNKSQASAIQHLLSRFGIFARLRKKECVTRIVRENKTYQSLSYIVSFSRSDEIDIFLNEIGFIGKKKAVENAVRVLKNQLGERLGKTSIRFQKIEEISELTEKDTFDIQVSDKESLQNFTAQGFIAHNSGKDFTISIIALYEAMKLLESPYGDPYKVYELGNANPFTILTIAGSKEQAKILFREIQGKFLAAPYFKDKFVSDGITMDKMHLLTPADKKENTRRAEKGITTMHPGSVVIEAGHSNSNTLVGKSCFALLLDEVATYKQTGGSGSGDQIYGNLSPTIKTYVRKEVKYGENGHVRLSDGTLLTGNVEKKTKGLDITENGQTRFIMEKDIKRHYDGKTISISSPRGMDGIFYKLYQEAENTPERIMCRLPTWVVNTKHTEESLRANEQSMTEEKFMMEYGAEFSGTEGENFFPSDLVDNCFTSHNYHLTDIGTQGITYFAHLDPATSSHNYALCVVHKKMFKNAEKGKVDYQIILDHVKFWHPTKGKPISIEEVDNYVIALNKMFHLGIVTYDRWSSASSIEKLRKVGIPAKETHFSKYYKIQIYDELYHLVSENRLKLPFCKLLKDEMLHLQRKYTGSGYRIYPKTDGEVKTDDCCVSPNTILFTKRGCVHIKDVVIGDSVFTGKGRFRTVTGTSLHIPNSEIVSIQPYYTNKLIATSNHPILVKSDEGLIWKNAGDIRNTDRICRTVSHDETALPKEIDMIDFVAESNKKHASSSVSVAWKGKNRIRDKNGNGKWHKRFVKTDFDLGFILGSYLAEGSIGNHSICFATHLKEKQFRTSIKSRIKRVFGIKKFFLSTSIENNSTCISFNSQIVKRFILSLIQGRIAPEKQMSVDVMHSSKEMQIGILKGMFQGDGSTTYKNQFTFTTTSKALVEQIQYILMRFGIVSSISISKRDGKVVYFKNSNKPSMQKDLYNVVIKDATSFNRYSELMGFAERKEQSPFHKPHYEWTDDSTLLCSVRKISKGESETVCNIAVDEDNSYVANGIVVHNCDALAGACYNAVRIESQRLPMSALVNMGISPTSNNREWMSMSGMSYGYGSGAQVARNLERRQSYPKR